MLFLSVQQELDCIDDSGCILGKIKFDGLKNKHIFFAANEAILVSDLDRSKINERLSGLDAGQYSIPMQDDD